MFRKILIATALTALPAALVIPIATAGPGAPQQLIFTNLDGASEVPGPGDPNGKGYVDIIVKKERKRVCFSLSFKRINLPTSGHIHEGASDEAGPIVVELFDDPIETNSGGCTRSTEDVVRRLTRQPANFYVNLHNGAYPDGAIRGQLETKPAACTRRDGCGSP